MKFRSNPIKKKKFKWNFANPIDQFIISLMAGVTYYIFSPLYTVHDGERAILFDRFRGVLNGSAGEGTHFLIPFLQKPIWFDVRTRPQYFSTVTGTKDLQVVKLSLCVLSHLDANHLPQNFSTLGYGYSEQVFRSICHEVLKAVVAQFNADQLLTERSCVSDLVRESLIQRAKDFNMVLDHVAITHLSYSAEFSEVVKQNQVALQEAERSKFMVAKAEQERRAAIMRAEGESESAKLISDATAAAGTALIKLRKVEAAKDNAVTMTKNANVMYVGKNMLFGFLVDRGQ